MKMHFMDRQRYSVKLVKANREGMIKVRDTYIPFDDDEGCYRAYGHDIIDHPELCEYLDAEGLACDNINAGRALFDTFRWYYHMNIAKRITGDATCPVYPVIETADEFKHLCDELARDVNGFNKMCIIPVENRNAFLRKMWRHGGVAYETDEYVYVFTVNDWFAYWDQIGEVVVLNEDIADAVRERLALHTREAD